MVRRGRQGRAEAKAAEEFLQEETAERSVQAAMMADAADEAMTLTREFDREDVNVPSIHRSLQDYQKRMRALFIDGLAVETGFTKMMIEMLRNSVRTLHLKSGLKILGGRESVPDSLLDRCLGRMAAYCKLGEEIISAEFPSFELMQAFWPLELNPHVKGLEFNAGEVKTALARLSQVLGLPAEVVYEEWAHYLPMAVDNFKRVPDQFAAWRDALARPPRGRPDHGRHVRQIVKRLGAWGVSTTGCERTFSKHVRTCDPQRGDMGEDTVDNDAVLLCMLPEDVSAMIQDARKVWAAAFNDIRAREMPRRDKGVKRGPNLNRTSEAQFVKRRRLDLTQRTQRHDGSTAELDVDAHWTEGHTKELAFQKKKQKIVALVALGDGTLLPSEVTDEMQHDLTVMQATDALNDKNLRREHERHNLKLRVHASHGVAHRRVFLQPPIAATPRMQAACRERHLVIVADRLLADIIVVEDIACVGQRAKLCLAMGGGVAANVEYIERSFQGGNAIAYKRALATRRLVWVSDAFQEAHPNFSEIVKTKATQAGSAWQLLQRAEFMRRAASTTSLSNQLLALVTKVEQVSVELRPIKLKLTSTDFETWIATIDENACRWNICGS